MAPNLVTLLGTSCLLLQCVVVVWQSPSLQGPLPWWACLLAALCNFLYSTLDAMDGKQAKRTKSSSPLGQLFDHGSSHSHHMPVCVLAPQSDSTVTLAV